MADGGARKALSRRARVALGGVLVVGAIGLESLAGAQPDGLGVPRPITTSFSTASGSGRIDPGLACAEGGEGGYWHYDYESPLQPGVLTGASNPLTGTSRLHLDLHSEQGIVRAEPNEPLPGSAWLQGTESAVTLANQRGTVRMRLSSAGGAGATCDSPHSLTFDGLDASGNATWQITEATGSYRDAVGTGTATLRASVRPGADNAASWSLNGNIAVLQPDLKLEVVDSYWAYLGAHYLLRRVTVIYRVTNVGQGDAYGVRLTAASSPTQGVKLIGPIPFDTSITSPGPVPQHLGDLPAGASEIVRLRWDLPNPSGNPPCGFIVLSCKFKTSLTFEMPDALDVPGPARTATVDAKAPDFPPPVVD